MSQYPSRARALIATAVLLICLVGCGGAQNPSPVAPGATPPARPSTPATATAPAPRYGGNATIGVVGDLRDLNPAFMPEGLVGTLLRPVTEGLFDRDAEGQPRPWLAESVPSPGRGISADGRTVIVRLRQGVAWEDGRAFTAADVLFTFAAAQDPANALAAEVAAAYRAILAVDALDPYTVRLTLAAPGDAYLRAFSPLLPAHLFNAQTGLAGHPYTRAPFGTGPFRLAEWVPGDTLTLARSASYRRGDRPYLSALTYRAYPDRAAAEAALRARAIDLILDADGRTLSGPGGGTGELRDIAPAPNAPPTWNAEEWWRSAR